MTLVTAESLVHSLWAKLVEVTCVFGVRRDGAVLGDGDGRRLVVRRGDGHAGRVADDRLAVHRHGHGDDGGGGLGVALGGGRRDLGAGGDGLKGAALVRGAGRGDAGAVFGDDARAGLLADAGRGRARRAGALATTRVAAAVRPAAFGRSRSRRRR